MAVAITEFVEYRNNMEFPIDNLTIALFGYGNEDAPNLEHHELVEHAAKKITMLKQMVVALGLSEKMLKIILEN